MISFSIKRYIGLIIVAIVIGAILFFIIHPEILSKIWLWAIGLAGSVIALAEQGIKYFRSNFSNSANSSQSNISIPKKEEDQKVLPLGESDHKNDVSELKTRIQDLEKKLTNQSNDAPDDFIGTTISVLRFQDDGETTLGLLFFDDVFFCYTLEDTHRDVKIKEQTRIPSGNYRLGFRKEVTSLTEKYRKTRPWFDFHIEILNVSNFSGVYIHNGSTTEDTAGCLLIADGIHSSDQQKMLQNSRLTFEKFYKLISEKLKKNENVRIKIFDESWFEHFKLKNKWNQ